MRGGDQSGSAVDRYVVLGGVGFHYRVTGPADAPVMVMLHGIMGHSREWDAFVADMTPSWRVVAVDQRGHGETDWTLDYTVEAMAGDLVALLEVLGEGPLPVVGHSLGGMVALVAAAARPELVSRLVVIDVGPDTVGGDLAAEVMAWITSQAAASFPDVDTATAEALEGSPQARPELLRHYVSHCLVARPDGRLVWRFDANNIGRLVTTGVTTQQLWDAIDEVTIPTLLIRGERSPALSATTAREMVQRLGDGAFVEIADAGHDLAMEQPHAVAEAVKDFLPS